MNRKKRRKHISAVIIAAAMGILFCFGNAAMAAEDGIFISKEEPKKEKEENSTNMQLYARSAVLMDADSGRILFGKNENEMMPMASTTKIMTCIVALENSSPEEIVTISEEAAKQPKVHLNMQKGQKFVLRDLLYSLMLESHNDSAVAVAEHIGQSKEGFAEMMNRKAKEIGCADTYFISANGLDAVLTDEQGEQKIHATTARDLARILKYCIQESPQKEEFLKITQTPSYSFADAEGKRSYSCMNHNAFLTMMEGAITGKTGFTNQAGYCYVGALQRDNRTFIVALLACGWPNNKTYKWKDTKQLMNYGLENYNYRNIYEKTEEEKVLVQNGIPENGKPYGEAYAVLRAEQEESGELEVLMRDDEETLVKVNKPKMLEAPVRRGEKVGAVEYYLENRLIKSYPIVAEYEIGKIDYKWIVGFILHRYLL